MVDVELSATLLKLSGRGVARKFGIQTITCVLMLWVALMLLILEVQGLNLGLETEKCFEFYLSSLQSPV